MSPIPAHRLRTMLPAASFVLLLAAIFVINPRAMSYFGLSIMLNVGVPLVLATLAQMMLITIGDIDLSIGAYVSLVVCIIATWLHDDPVLGAAALILSILVYGGIGVLIQWRKLPSIVVTLGLSFVWQGLAITLLPDPGGQAPDWIIATMNWRPPFVPFPILASIVVAVVMHFLVMRSSFGVVLRGAGGNLRAIARGGWSMFLVRGSLYCCAGALGVLSGFALVGITTSGDANTALRYTLFSIAGVILGGGEFVGGKVSAVGAVLGALTLTLAVTLLSFVGVSTDWQVGAQGTILIAVLGLRALLERRSFMRLDLS